MVNCSALGCAVIQGDKNNEGVAIVNEHLPDAMSALSSILSIAASVRSLQREFNLNPMEALKRFLGKANPADRDLLNQPGIKEAVVELLVISEKLLKQLSREAHECEERHIEARQAAQDQTSKDVADVRAANCMCSVLRSIKKHNGMNLPEKDVLKGFWKSYNCD